MAKKKKRDAKDELIDQLLNDVNDIAADSSLEDSDEDPHGATLTGQGPEGLTVLAPEAAEKNGVWEDLRDDLGLEQSVAKTESPASSGDSEKPAFNLVSDVRGTSTGYRGPSVGEGGYQSFDELNLDPVQFESDEGHENEPTRALAASDKTAVLGSGNESPPQESSASIQSDHEPTVAADGFAARRPARAEPQEKVVIGSLRGNRSGNVHTSMDASLAQAENLRIAQQRILDLEKENDRLRQENEEVSSAADIIRSRLEELTSRITALEREKSEIQEAGQNEIMILKGNLQFKESEVAKARLKIDELDTRLRNDFKKIRVKERELENRLELARAEKAALVRAKDENILELKRKIDQSQSEIDNYREKLLEMNKTIEANQEQFRRTVRALRLALTNLEAKDENLVPLKKAE